MRVYAATTNAGKLRELAAILAAFGWDVQAFDGYREAEEGEVSYAENAALKARALARQLRAAGIADPVVADDSGIEADALGGRPGVLSARYGGPGITWEERRRLLLAEVAQNPSAGRGARFVCAMHYIEAGGFETAVTAAFPGEIARAERGEGGFSYDPIFYDPQRGRTFGELPQEEKNAISHRALAARALAARVGARRSGGM